MDTSQVNVFALSGDTYTTPQDTLEAYWSALAAGANGLALTIHMTSDLVPVCIANDSLLSTTKVDKNVVDVSAKELEQLDAGCLFQSQHLDESNRSIEQYGEDFPWTGQAAKMRNVTHPTLWNVLTLFGRRCELLLLIPDRLTQTQIDVIIEQVHQAGLVHRVIWAANALNLSLLPEQTIKSLITDSPLDDLDQAKQLSATSLMLSYENLFPKEALINDTLLNKAIEKNITLLTVFKEQQPAPSPALRYHIEQYAQTIQLLVSAPLATLDVLHPPACIIEDAFTGEHIVRDIWSAGYSHQNEDTIIYQQNGLHIEIQPEGSYSGAAAICRLPIHGNFDARTHFYVENPKQGTTFEMAAISIDPGYHHIDNTDLNSRNVNLTFDVHGAPPYASSERDEDNGFRCGWNNGFNLTRIASDWSADSVNMYNKYGRDVGNGSTTMKTGELRLVRNGSLFASYYRDASNSAWVNCGTMMVHNLANNVFIRLAAKHWNKHNQSPPENHVIFNSFQLYQR